MCVRVSKGLAGLGAGAGRGNKTPRGLKGPHETRTHRHTHSRKEAESLWLSAAPLFLFSDRCASRSSQLGSLTDYFKDDWQCYLKNARVYLDAKIVRFFGLVTEQKQ